MLRALRVLLAAALLLPAQGWAAGNVSVGGAASAAGPVAAPAASVPAIPSLPPSAIPGLSATLGVEGGAALSGPAASGAAAPAPAAARAAEPAAMPSAMPSAAPAVPGAAIAGPRALPASAIAAHRAAAQLAAGDERDHAALHAALKAAAANDNEGQAEQPGFLERAFDAGARFFDHAAASVAGEASPEASPERSGRGRGGSRGGSGGGGGDKPSPGADDGGGDNYPYRSIRFHGKLFRSVLFRPNVPVEPEIIRAIDTAKKSIHIALYEFKLPGVLDALRRARERGVEIHIVLDYSNVYPSAERGDDSTGGDNYQPRRSREIWALLREGFDVKVLRGLSKYGINHNKLAIIDYAEGAAAAADESMAIFGSYNWSWSAEQSHYENAVFSNDRVRVEALKKYWDWLDTMAIPEKQARDHQWPATVPAPPVQVAETVAFNGVKLPPVVLSPSRVAGQTIEDRLVQAIDASKKSIDASAFAVRSTKIAEALARAVKRGLKVRVIFDEGQAQSEPFGLYAQYLAANGVQLRTLAGPDPNSDFPLAQKDHHKFAVFDGKLVETGSANFTKYASAANFENAHFLDEAKDVAGYAWIFERMFKRANAFPAPAHAPTLPTDAELEAEVSQTPAPAPAPEPHPGPTDPSIKPRPIPFHGEVFPSFAFRPDTPVAPLIVQAINSAKKSVRMAVYEFNLPEVLDALRAARKRGVKVEMVIDQSHVYTRGKDHTGQQRKPSAEILSLINEGFDLLTLKGEKSGIMHNKYLLVDAEDGGLLEFGSYNYAKTAEENHYENVKFSNDPRDVADYLAYFNYKRGLASPIDHDKLDEVLNRGLSEDDGEATPEARGSGDARDSKYPPPPESTAPTVQYNGQTFHRHYFSPQGGILDAWVRAVNAAEESIDIAMFGFYAREVADAIVARMERAKKEGKEFKVRLVLDAGQSSLAKFDGVRVSDWFAQRGADVRLKAGPNPDGDPMFEKQHSKFLIVDGKLLMTGSFNLSPTAENLSFENENVVDNPTDLAGYVEFFGRMFGLGWPPAGAAKPAPPKGRTSTHHGL